MITRIKSLKFCLSLLFIFYLCFTPISLSSEEIKILVYNTHGLPAVFAGDDPKERFPLIGEKIKPYQLVNLLNQRLIKH